MEDLLQPISSMFEEETPVEEQEFEEQEVIEEKEVEEEENDEEELDSDPTSVKTFYNVWKEFLPFDETEEPTEDFIREQQAKMPEKFFLSYVESRPDFIQDFLAYQSNLDNPKPEDLKEFWDKYVAVEKEFTIEDNDSARNYLKTRPELRKLYNTDEKMNRILDMMEDDNELVDKAKEFFEEDLKNKEKEKQSLIENTKKEKEVKLQREKEFAQKVNQTIDELKWAPDRKQKAMKEIAPSNISEKWNKIATNPKALVQFADFLSYFDDNGFDAFYNLIEGKKKSDEVVKVKETIKKDSFGKLFSKHSEVSSKSNRSLLEDFG